MTYVADDADLVGLIYPEVPAREKNLRMMLDLFEAAGYQQTITSCQAGEPFGYGTSDIVCGFDFDMIGSDELGLGPVTGSRFVFTVVDGEIVRAWLDWDSGQVSSQLVKPFRDWVAATHPRDDEVMFFGRLPERLKRLGVNRRPVEPRLNDESMVASRILWKSTGST